jgi:aspartate aminotransferase
VTRPISSDVAAMIEASPPFFEFFTHSEWARRAGEEGICDFVTCEPQEMPLPGVVEALSRWVHPQNPHWSATRPASQQLAQSWPNPYRLASAPISGRIRSF